MTVTKKDRKELIQEFSPNEYMQKKYGINVDDKTFCILPFCHFSTTTNGEVRLCCRSKKVWNINESTLTRTHPDHTTKTGIYSIKDLWQGTTYNKIRKDLIAGIRVDKCNACWALEDKGIVSLRQDINYMRIDEFSHLVDHWSQHQTAAWEVPVIELKLSNLCNLKCKMCWPKDSTPWIKQWPIVEKFFNNNERHYINTIIDANDMYRTPLLNLFESNSMFMNDLAGLIDGVTTLEFAGGEPLLDPLHYKILETIPDPSKVTLKYSTNLTSLNSKKDKNILDIWKKFKKIKLMVSIDGDSSLNSYIRTGSDWNIIKDNVQKVKDHLGQSVSIIASTCISAMNIEHLPATIDAIEQDMKIEWYTSRLHTPSFLHGNVIPVDRLQLAKTALINKLSITDSKWRKRHISDAILWIDECINNNSSNELYQTFVDYTNLLNNIK